MRKIKLHIQILLKIAFKLTVIGCFYNLALIVMPVQAEEQTSAKKLDFKQQIEMLKKAKKATVVLYAPLRKTESERYDGDNAKFIKTFGCNFVNLAQDKIANLVGLLKHNHLKYIPQKNPYLPYLGVSIYFTYENGQEGQILLGRQYLGETTIDGELKLAPSFHAMTVLIDNSIYRDIYNWITHSEIERGAGYNGSDYPYYNREKRIWITLKDVEQGLAAPYSESYERKWTTTYLETCEKYQHADYYRNSTKQTCTIPKLERAYPDVCEVGWKPPMQGTHTNN